MPPSRRRSGLMKLLTDGRSTESAEKIDIPADNSGKYRKLQLLRSMKKKRAAAQPFKVLQQLLDFKP